MSESKHIQNIRDRAYALWQEAGSPDGRDHEFWHQAETMEGAADAPNDDVDRAGEESFPASDPTNRT